MASSPTRAESSQASQAIIAAEAARLAAKAWPNVDVHDLRGSLPQLRMVVAAAIRHYSPAAITDALRFYRRERAAAGIAGSPRFTLPKPAPLEQIGKSVDWAAEPLWGASDLQAAEKRLESVVERLVLNAGREAIVAAVEQDRQAKAWARVPEPDACYFCAMLATRGAIYSSAHAAGDNNDYHDHCRCHVEPVFVAYEPTARIRQWQADWNDLKREHGGVSLSVWRAHYDATYSVA